ncbi:MAG: hypothetical protein ACTHOD_00405 [Motilibacteraceae bacterium]
MAVHRGSAWFEPPWWTVCVEPFAVDDGPDGPNGAAVSAVAADAGDGVDAGPADGGRVQGGSYAEAHALAVKQIATAAGVAESSVTLLLELLPEPRQPS